MIHITFCPQVDHIAINETPTFNAKDAESSSKNNLIARRATLSRTMCMDQLSHFTGAWITNLTLTKNIHGKPHICGSQSDVFFSISHSDTFWAMATTRGQAIGLDIQVIKTIKKPIGVAKTIMNTDAFDTWMNLEKAKKNMALLKTWTCKEAIIKCLGASMWRHPKHLILQETPEGIACTIPDHISTLNYHRYRVRHVMVQAINLDDMLIGYLAYEKPAPIKYQVIC